MKKTRPLNWFRIKYNDNNSSNIRSESDNWYRKNFLGSLNDHRHKFKPRKAKIFSHGKYWTTYFTREELFLHYIGTIEGSGESALFCYSTHNGNYILKRFVSENDTCLSDFGERSRE